MSKLALDIADESDAFRIGIRLLDPELRGKQATLHVLHRAEVQDKRPVHSEQELHVEALQLDAGSAAVRLDKHKLQRRYTHRGEQLHLKMVVRVVVDDGIIFDSSEEQHFEFPLAGPPRTASDDPKLMDPKDAFSFIANVAVLPLRNKLIVFGLLIVGGIVVLGNLALGYHDEFVPESQTIFYDHRGDDGSESPIMKALFGSGGAGIGVWVAIMFQLRKYMRFELKKHGPIRRNSRYRLSDLVDGEARVPLQDVVVRVVACNRECGAYKRGSGTSERTVTFKKPIRAIKLFERRVLQIPPHRPIGMYLDGEVDFQPMFDALLPPLKLGSDHGIDVCWEVQFLHPLFVDHELDGGTEGLRWEDFVEQPA